jgi:hypothetical protein
MAKDDEVLAENDIVKFVSDSRNVDKIHNIFNILKIRNTFEVSDFMQQLLQLVVLGGSCFQKNTIDTLQKGITCQAMTVRQQGWQSGKVKLVVNLVFVPDEPAKIEEQFCASETTEIPSPLDEIRKQVEG